MRHHSHSASGFSLIELAIAIAVCGIALSAAGVAFYRLPFETASLEHEYRAWQETSVLLQRDRTLAEQSGLAGITADSIDMLDNASARLISGAAWSDALGKKRLFTASEPVIAVSSTAVCDPLVSGNWSKPRVLGIYTLASGMLPNLPSSTYPISALAATSRWLVAAISQTATANAPTLLFFPAHGTLLSPAAYAFDNASTSSVGITALASGDGYLYAGNGFGSASTTTCSDGYSCSQVQVYRISSSTPQRISSFSLPFVSADGSSATVASLAYANGYLYIGLHKTANGEEFVIADAHDPFRLRLLGGIPIAHSITAILPRGDYAYIATDDTTRESIAVAVSDPMHPRITQSWDAPGSIGFGYGTAVSAFLDSLLVGRTYVNNAPELALISATSSNWTSLASVDIGTTKSPESIRSILRQDFLAFVLTNHSLRTYKVEPPQLVEYAPPLSLPAGATGTSLACKGGALFIGYTTSDGYGTVEAVQGS